MSNCSSCLSYSRLQSLNFSKTHVSCVLLYHLSLAGIPLGRTNLGAELKDFMMGLASILPTCPLSQMLLWFPLCCRAAPATANFSGDSCHCLKKSHPALLLEKLLHHCFRCSCYYTLVAGFLGTVCTTGMAKDLLITQGFDLSYFLSFLLPFIHSWGKGEMLYIYSYVNNVEHISW